MKEEFLKNLEIEYESVYDFIANNYSKFTKDELKDILLEIIYAIYRHNSYEDEERIYEIVKENLHERWNDLL